MKKDEIKKTLQELAFSQGLYGRILESIEDSDDPEAIYDELEAKDFKDPVDLIMFIEE